MTLLSPVIKEIIYNQNSITCIDTGINQDYIKCTDKGINNKVY